MFTFFSPDKPSNPKIVLLGNRSDLLPPCPKTPNCVRRVYKIAIDPPKLFALSLETIRVMGANIKHQSSTDYNIHAVYDVVVFKDDVNILIEDSSNYSLLHIRSTSRKGSYDFGVNKRRINHFIQKLGDRF